MTSIFDPAPAHEWRYNAVAERYHDSDSKIAAGYRRAADLIVEAWPEERFDPLLAPVILLYRHAIELELKTAIRMAERAKSHAGLPHRDLSTLNEWFKNKAGHRLAVLRDDLAGSLVALSAEPMDPTVSKLIEELHTIDPGGETFRYAWTREKDASGQWVVVQTERPGDGNDGRVNVMALGDSCSAAVDHIGAIWSLLEEEYVRPNES